MLTKFHLLKIQVGAILLMIGGVPQFGYADTLADVIQKNKLNNFIHQIPAERAITSYAHYHDQDIFLLAYYVLDKDDPYRLDSIMHLLFINKHTGNVHQKEVLVEQWLKPKGLHYLGSILNIKKIGLHFYLKGHLSPSANPTLVLTDKLEYHDVIMGWIVDQNEKGETIYRHNQIHFAPPQAPRYSVYDPVTKLSEIYKKVWKKNDAVRSIPTADYFHQGKKQAQLVYALTEQSVNDIKVFVTVHEGPTNVVRIFSQQNEELILLEEFYTSHSVVRKPNIFRAPVKGDKHRRQFIQITEIAHGTGHFTTEHIYEVVYDGELNLRTVNFIPAAESYQSLLNEKEGVWKGVFSSFENGKGQFEFYIWNEGDGNCCPSAGKVKGTYKIVYGKNNDPPITIEMDQYQRLPVD